MSMPFLVFSCTACEYQGDDTVLWGKFSYHDQVRRVPVNRVLGWCKSCDALSPIEVLPSSETIHELEMQIEEKATRVNGYKAAAATGRSWLGKVLGFQPPLPPEIQQLDFQRSYAADQLEEERDRLDFLRGRSTPPRCLFCGGEDWLAIPRALQPRGTDEEPGPATPIGMTHPGCSGQLLVAYSGLRVSRRPNHRLYGPDGNLLPMGAPKVGPKEPSLATRKMARQLLRERWDREAAARDRQSAPSTRSSAPNVIPSREPPVSAAGKDALIKNLVRLRVRSDPLARAMGFDETMVDSLSGLQLAGVPEATIVTIVETWAMLHNRGHPDAEIFARIEDHRSRTFSRGQMPSPLNLTNYVKYRLKLEHSHGAPIEEVFIESAIEAAKEAYAA